MSTALDGWRLAVGTLTTVPVRPPEVVDRRTASWAVALAPLAVLPLGVLAGVVVWAAAWAGLPGLAAGLLVVGLLALGTRGLHVDGLSDVADGLTASYDAERSLAAMKGGTSGPAGTVALIVVLGLQAVGVSSILLSAAEPGVCGIVVGLLVCLSRWSLLVTCVAPGARVGGLGAPFARCVRPGAAVVGSLVVVAATAMVGLVALPIDTGAARGAISGVVALGVSGLLTRRVVRRLGGTTGDVHGAGIELVLAVLLIGVAWVDTSYLAM